MKIRNIATTPVVMASILAVLTVGIAGAKSYAFQLPAASMAGSQELKADQRYSVEFNGSQAVIKGEKDRQTVNLPVKAEQSPTKFVVTSVETTEGASPSDPRTLKAIQLGGTNTRLVFVQ